MTHQSSGHGPRNRLIRVAGVGLLALATVMLGACATTPSPAEVCSASWIKPRTDSALADFKRTTKDSWERLRKTGENAARQGNLGLVEKARVILSLTTLVSSFQNSQALTDLQTLGQTCNDPDLVRNALVGTLEEYNVPAPYIKLLNELDDFRRLLEETSTVTAPRQ